MSDLISFVNQSSGSTSNSAQSQSALASDFDTFLTLLTAQLQNQDPLEPTDSTEFTNQLVQFSGVEQQIQTNDALEQLIASNNSATGAAMSSYLGQSVEINSQGAGYSGEDLSWRYALASDATEATFNIQDKNGKVLYSEPAEKSAGSHEFVWDGTLSDGTIANEDEVYYASVTAKDSEANSITTSTNVLTTVSGVDLSYDSPAITTKAGIFSYSDILRVMQS
ncbi:flagellar hook assembly protein FlgD [Hirschia baltica]|uniref:Basal-body rod modification protein FlgD n=1 Tax=Hirschia baltica (strain ATCC 49814 / DSM 5838 / IFAM 1418) TaxID=582402 RepID=C6XM56_HIRBI|nr:flagellar hook capping FlgD N-terminal domain-containing protein [Hirschia baltica]ACT59888.1 flagellar hook capping protein [Hirschia baltica ATCC 49814]